MNKFVRYMIHVGDATSQLINTAVLLSDNPNESVSGRAYRLNDQQGWKQLEKTLNFIFAGWQEDHCKQSFLNDVARAKQLVKEQGKVK